MIRFDVVDFLGMSYLVSMILFLNILVIGLDAEDFDMQCVSCVLDRCVIWVFIFVLAGLNCCVLEYMVF